MRITKYILLLLALLLAFPVAAQKRRDYEEADRPRRIEDSRNENFRNDSTETTDVPIGIHCWTADPRFGYVRPAQMDTVEHAFPMHVFTSGMTGEYNYTGNLGAPRQARLFLLRPASHNAEAFIFAQPLDFFLPAQDQYLFTNTRSPYTSITYNKCGSRQNGEDRITARFSVNVGKKLGLGFRLDYLYGRGYYQNQQTAHFNAGFFASYLGDQYQAHLLYNKSHLKAAENGGIESDDYVMRPEILPTSYGTADIPVVLNRAWQKLNVGELYFSHRYALGRMIPDETKPLIAVPRLKAEADSLKVLMDSLLTAAADTVGAAKVDSVRPQIFAPVTSFVHTFKLQHNDRRFIQNGGFRADRDGYFADFFLPGDSANDYTRHLSVSNLLALELAEGLNRWVPMGLRLFARHRYQRFTLPSFALRQINYKWGEEADHEHLLAVGAEVFRLRSKRITYSALGEYIMSGGEWGQFNAEASAALHFQTRRDTLGIRVSGFVRRELPSYYYRHYHGRNAWWDNDDMKGEFRTRVQGTLCYSTLSLSAGFETVQRHAYFAEQLIPYGNNGTAYAHRVTSQQASGNISLLDVTFRGAHAFGPLNLETRLTLQKSTNQSLYPLPLFDGYANVYLLFRISKVLRTELGGDVRFFTRYHAPAYSPILLQYVLQDPEYAVKIGGYPIINVYANLHIQRTRFYVMCSHVNAKKGSGNPFLVPHHPLNQMVIRFGVSWNFVN